jgi:hypothetical protein
MITTVLVLPFIGLGSLLSQPMRSTVIVAFVVLLAICGVRGGRAAIGQMRAEARQARCRVHDAPRRALSKPVAA